MADGWPARWVTPVRGDGSRGDEFLEWSAAYCRQVKDSIVGRSGELVAWRPWQRELFTALLATDNDQLAHKTALIGKARKNGKSFEGSALALYGLFMGPDGGEVYSCAGTRQQARIVFDSAKRMVELDSEMSGLCNVYRDAIEVTSSGSVYRVLSAEAGAQEGLNPTLVIFDEVHVQPNDELWLVMEQAMGNRHEPLLVGITTAGVRTDSHGRDSLCYRLYRHGQRVARGEVDDPSFFMAWWEPADPQSDHRERSTWLEANPGFGDLVAESDFEAKVKRTPESDFRTKRCNQWVASETAWLPAGRFEDLADVRDVTGDVVLAFDGSYSGDCTAIVGCTIPADDDERPYVFVVNVWEAPDGDVEWRVPIHEVEQSLRDACRRWQVRRIVCDPFRWQRSLQTLEAEGLPLVEFPQSPARMVPATKDYTDMVLDDGLVHDGHPKLLEHHRNAVLKNTPRGSQLAKEHKASGRKIDAAVCAVMAHATAANMPASSAVFAFYD